MKDPKKDILILANGAGEPLEWDSPYQLFPDASPKFIREYKKRIFDEKMELLLLEKYGYGL